MNKLSKIAVSDLVAVNASVNLSIDELAVSAAYEGFAVTAAKYRVPLSIETKVKTDSNNIRIKFAKGMIILNWEVNSEELRWENPSTGEWEGVAGVGRVPENEWIKVKWIIEEDYTVLIVNDEERLRSIGNFGGAAGQVGIGTAFGATVTLQNLQISGEATSTGEEIVPPPRFRSDGGFIYVNYADHDKAIQWYKEHLGLQLKWPTWEGQHDPASRAEKMSSLEFPEGGLIHLKSAASEVPLKHFIINSDKEGTNVGFTFNSPNLRAARQSFLDSGVRVGDIELGPDGREWFDLHSFNGTLHAIRSDERDGDEEGLNLIAGYGPWYVRVRNLDEAVSWYRDILGISAIRVIEPKKCVEMDGNFLLIYDESSQPNTCVDGPSCPYFFTTNIEEEFERFTSLNVKVSEVVGTGWKAMHIYDPFGNRLNFWTY